MTALEEIAPAPDDLVDERTRDLIARRRASKVKRRGWLVRRMLLLADVVGLVAAFALAELVAGHQAQGRVEWQLEVPLFAVTLPMWVVVAKLYGLYDRDEERVDHTTAEDIVGVFHVVTIGAWLVYAGARLTTVADPDLVKIGVFWGAAIGGISLARVGARAYAHRHVSYLQNTVIVGTDPVARLIADKFLRHPEYGINLVGFVDGQPGNRADELAPFTLLGALDDVPALVRLLDIERVIIAFSSDDREAVLSILRDLNELDVQVDFVPRFHEVLSPAVDIHAVEGLPLIGLRPPRLSSSSALLKRWLDLVGSACGLLLLSPLLALVALAIKLDSRGPVLFRQVRMGVGDRAFRIVKFRTMAADADERKAEVAHLNKHARNGGDPRMFKIEGDPRVTRVGRWLRRFSVDELPQLWNVLRGEMSLVGPRPLILAEHAHVSDWGERRLDLRPGITGLWQVLGRDDIPFAEMVNLDYLYVTSWSLGGDVRLLLRTLPAVVRRGA